MRIRFIEQTPVAADGVNVIRYAPGDEADIPDGIARDLVRAKLAEKMKKAGKRGD